jgi:hypothetical protein
MPQKVMFSTDDGSGLLLEILNKLNAAMAGVKNAKTVEELQVIINNLNRVVADLKKVGAQ